MIQVEQSINQLYREQNQQSQNTKLSVVNRNQELQFSSSHLLFGISPESAIMTFFLGFPL